MRAALLAAATVALAAADSYFVIGDWGGIPTAPYTTPAEVLVAGTLGAAVAKSGANTVLALGDNFYYNGVTSVDDPRFQQTFESVFTAPSLQGPTTQFMVIAGNHDHYGNASAEVAYTAKSNRWSFTDFYYTFSKTTTDGATVEFVMIDTVLLAGNSDLPNGGQLHGDELPGPSDNEVALTQWQWINATLAASTADYLVVAGHYPVWSICEHGPTSLLVSTLKPMLQQYKATAYLAGHDHCAEYIDEGLGVQYHGLGAAHGCDNSTAHASAIPAGALKYHFLAPNTNDDNDDFNAKVGAFGVITVDKTSFVVQHLDDSGNVLYTAPALSPRN